jgi:hypothetical protein
VRGEDLLASVLLELQATLLLLIRFHPRSAAARLGRGSGPTDSTLAAPLGRPRSFAIPFRQIGGDLDAPELHRAGNGQQAQFAAAYTCGRTIGALTDEQQ